MRINHDGKSRAANTRPTTHNRAANSSVTVQARQPTKRLLVIPKSSPEGYKYTPMAFFEADVIVSSELMMIEGATNFHFGILSSTMHMAWVRQICGRLKSDSRYSAKLVYNNYPWPESPTDRQKTAVEAKAQAVLDARAAHPHSCLADLYHATSMPTDLTKSHDELDRAVDACYRAKPFHTDRERVEFLFALYEKLSGPLTAGLPEPKRRRGGKKS